MRVAILGTGKMGSAICLRLLENGHVVTVWNRTRNRLEPLLSAGAQEAPSPRLAAEGAEVVLSIVTDGRALDAIYGGRDGVLAADFTGKCVLEMSTVRPGEQVALARSVRSKGGRYVECPVGGTTSPARQGKLLGLAGGEAVDIESIKPLLEQLCRRVEHVGPVGAGASMKLAINLPLLVAYQALGEAVALCRSAGMDAHRLMELFSDTSGAPNVLKTRGPAIADALVGRGTTAPAFDIDSIRKDLRTMLAEARDQGTSLPLAERTLAVFDQAAAEGWGSRDGTWLPSYWPGKSR